SAGEGSYADASGRSSALYAVDARRRVRDVDRRALHPEAPAPARGRSVFTHLAAGAARQRGDVALFSAEAAVVAAAAVGAGSAVAVGARRPQNQAESGRRSQPGRTRR